MSDCVIVADGYSYERSPITSWLQDSSNSPMTGKPLLHNHLLPNLEAEERDEHAYVTMNRWATQAQLFPCAWLSGMCYICI